MVLLIYRFIILSIIILSLFFNLLILNNIINSRLLILIDKSILFLKLFYY